MKMGGLAWDRGGEWGVSIGKAGWRGGFLA